MINFKHFNGNHVQINDDSLTHEKLRGIIISDMVKNTKIWSADKKILVTESDGWKCIAWNTGDITRFSCKHIAYPIELYSFWMNTSSVKGDFRKFMEDHPETRKKNEDITWNDVI